MKRLLTLATLVALCGFGLNLAAQQTPSTQDPAASQQAPASQTPSTQTPSQTPSSPDMSATQSQVNTQNQSARSFEGKITKSGDKLVLQDSSTQSSYQLDDQDKAKQYEGKNVKVMATMDPSTNTLHVVDIAPSEK